MIVIDTHVWVWKVDQNSNLKSDYAKAIRQNEVNGLGVSIISCWEVAKLVEIGRLQFSISVEKWMAAALNYPNIRLLDLTPEIAIESTKLPGNFHKDPADQIIVATARIYDIPIVTMDDKMRNYPHVKLLP